MSITAILSDKDLSADDKLDKVKTIVSEARKSYGNEDVTIEPSLVNTVGGTMPFKYLENDSKVAILIGEVQRIKSEAVSFVETNPGTTMKSKVQELLAVNSLFCNIETGKDYDYL